MSRRKQLTPPEHQPATGTLNAGPTVQVHIPPTVDMPPVADLECCGNCKCFLPKREPEQEVIAEGICRRYPPWSAARVITLQVGRLTHQHEPFPPRPIMPVDDWCEEWRPKPKSKE